MTIFTYGQTASGKTFTMRGTDQLNPGIIPLSLREIFHELYTNHGQPFKAHHHHGSGSGGFHHHNLVYGGREEQSPKVTKLKTWVVKVSYIEIYNECVNDLLDPTRKNL